MSSQSPTNYVGNRKHGGGEVCRQGHSLCHWQSMFEPQRWLLSLGAGAWYMPHITMVGIENCAKLYQYLSIPTGYTYLYTFWNNQPDKHQHVPNTTESHMGSQLLLIHRQKCSVNKLEMLHNQIKRVMFSTESKNCNLYLTFVSSFDIRDRSNISFRLM